MPEIDGFKTILPLNPTLSQLTREAQDVMDGYEPMTGKIGIEITFLVRDEECFTYNPINVLNAFSGIVFNDMPDADSLQVHIFRGCTNPSLVIDVWKEKNSD